MSTPSTYSETLDSATLSDALTPMLTLPETMEPLIGLVMVTAGGVTSVVVVLATVATGTVVYGRITGATPRTATTPASATTTSDRDARDATLRAFNDSTRKALAAAPTAADSARIMTRRRSDSTQAALQQALRDVRAQRPRGVFPAPDPSAPLVSLGDIKVVGGYALGAMGFAAMAFMLAMLLRSTGGAVGLFFLYLAFLEQLIGLMLRQFGSAELASKVMPYMPVSALRAPMNPDVWHAAYVERQNAIAASVGQPALVVNADMLKLIGLPLVWIAVFLGVTFLVFRRRDL